MYLRLGLVLVAAAALVGFGGGSSSPERVARAWSKALNAGDDEHAARLFAPRAIVIQGALGLVLRTHADAVLWNSGLPCSGRIVAVSTKGDTILATFVLGQRPHHRCDAPGGRAAAVMVVHRGKIVLWRQVPPPPPPKSAPPPKGAI